MIDHMDDACLDVDFDFGTSPHGLPADGSVSDQETDGTSGNRFDASWQAPQERAELPLVYCGEEVQRACRSIQAAAKQHHYPLVLSTIQMKRLERALSLALDDAIQALEDEPECVHEIQPDIDGYNQICALLKLAKAANKGGYANEDWRGSAL